MSDGRLDEAARSSRIPRPISSIQARRHPWAILGLWSWESALALLVGWPAASLVKAAYGDTPWGENALWVPGSHALVDFLWHESHALTALASGAALLFVVAFLASLVPLAALLFAMAFAASNARALGPARSLAAAANVLSAFVVLLVVLGLCEGLVAGAGLPAANVVEAWFHDRLGEAPAQGIQCVVVLVFVAVASVVGVVHDLARSAVVRTGATGWRAMEVAGRTFGRAPGPLWASWAWRTITGAALAIAGVILAGRVRGHGGLALACIVLGHQGIVLSRVALRASWLARTLRAVAAFDPREDAAAVFSAK